MTPTPTQLLLAVNLLEASGFVVRHKSEAVAKLQWHEAPGFGSTLDVEKFRARALGEVRKQLTMGHLVFSKRDAPSTDPEKPPVTIHTAELLVLR